LIGFAAKSGWLCAVALGLWVCGSWRAGLLIRHALELSHALSLPDSAFGRHYCFSVSGWVVRPLWTCRAASAGARATMVYYSLNCLRFTADEPPAVPYGSGEALGSWDSYVVPSADLGNTLAELRAAPVEINVHPLLGVEDDGSPISLPRPDRTVAVFDVSIFLPTVIANVIRPLEFYTLENLLAFFEDIGNCAAALDLDIAWKSKREISDTSRRRYIDIVDDFSQLPFVHRINPNVSAVRLAQSCAATISIPFTTPSVYAVAQSKPAIYYDPTGRMAAHTPRFHGVPVVSGRVALMEWLRTQVVPAEALAPLDSGNASGVHETDPIAASGHGKKGADIR
jgi:polysaccharide biosynthesis PFTS motif protein